MDDRRELLEYEEFMDTADEITLDRVAYECWLHDTHPNDWMSQSVTDEELDRCE